MTKKLAFVCDWCGKKFYSEQGGRCLACEDGIEREREQAQGYTRCGGGSWLTPPRKSAS